MAQWTMQDPEWELHPEGVFIGELAKFTDEGVVETRFGDRERGYYEVQTDEVDSQGVLFSTLRVYVYPGTSEKARITQLRNAVAGRKLKPEELRGMFDPESLLGNRLQVQVVHNQNGDKVYANIETMMPLPAGANVSQDTPSASATTAGAQDQANRWSEQGAAQEQAPGAGAGDLPF